MNLPKLSLNRKNKTLVGILIIALSIPVTLALISVSQELRRRAAPPEIKTYRFLSDPASDGYLEKFKEGYNGFTCFGAYDNLLSEPAAAPQGLAQETVNVGSFCLPWGPFWMRRLFLSYDTSSIPENEMVISAKVCATIKSTSSSIVGPPITISIYQYPWQTAGSLSSSDWDERSEDDFQNYLVEDLTEFPLVVDVTYYKDVDPARINKEGRTEYRLSAKTERMDGNTHYLPFYTGDAANENFRPCLEVTTSTAPPPKATITGIKFEDIDGNQTQDSGEPGMVGVTIILKNSSGVEISRTTTNEDGYFEFRELDSGDYLVEESVPGGYENTTPKSVEVNGLESGQEREVIFGNRAVPPPEKGRISGYKWNDQNGNGVWDTGEPPYTARIVVTLSGTSSGTDLTDETGYFEFSDLDPGDYMVEETPPADWRPTTDIKVPVTIAAGGDETVNFGNVFVPPAKAKIFGHKFNDINGNGSWDTASEPGIGRVIITLKDGEGTVLSSTETLEGTDLGYYLFENLEPGDYIVAETVPEGFQATTAASFEVTLGAGDERQFDFGNRETGGGPQDPICQSLTAAPTSGTIPLMVNFTAVAVDPDGSVVSYEYDFGDGSNKEVLTNATTSHIYQTAGTYAASVRVRDNDGAWATSANCRTSITASTETLTHTVCRGESCILISGSGANECTNNDACKLDRHTICQTPANACIEIEGAGVNKCTTDTDCQPGAPPTHTICRDYKCVSVSGAGVNECSNDANCVTTVTPPAPTPEPIPPAAPPPTSKAPVPPTASTAKTWTLLFSSITLIALGILAAL